MQSVNPHSDIYALKQIHDAMEEQLKNREVSPNNSIAKLFYLLPQFRIGAIDPEKAKIPIKVLQEVIMHCENINHHIFSTIQSLSKFLNVGIIDRDTGIIEQDDICNLAHHLQKMGELGQSIHELEASAREELKKIESEH